MSNERHPQDDAKRIDPTDNPFFNPDTVPGDAAGAEHGSDDPGRDFDTVPPRTQPALHEGGKDQQRHPHSGASSPSEPRRVGTGGRQAPRRESATTVTAADPVIPGEIMLADAPVTINEGLAVTTLRVENRSDRPIQVGSHFHFAEVNPALAFDRDQAWGKRLNVLSGGAMRFEPGNSDDVELVPIGGRRIALGFRGECRGALDG